MSNYYFWLGAECDIDNSLTMTFHDGGYITMTHEYLNNWLFAHREY